MGFEEIRSKFLHSVNRMFAIFADDPLTRRMVLRAVQSCRGRPMRTLRRIQAMSLRTAPQWILCVFFGAYVTLQVATSGSYLG